MKKESGKGKYEWLMLIFALLAFACVYWAIKSFLGLFMSDGLSWVGLSLLLTYLAYDMLKLVSGINK